MIDKSFDHLHNDFEHATTLKVDYLGVVYVWPYDVSLGLEHIDRRFTEPLKQCYLEISCAENKLP